MDYLTDVFACHVTNSHALRHSAFAKIFYSTASKYHTTSLVQFSG